jgi:hypothetical protein
LSRKLKVSLKSDKNNGYFTWIFFTFMKISRWIPFRMRNILNKTCRENRNTHFVFNIFFFRKKIMFKNLVVPERPQMIVWRVRVACWISKATSAHAHASAHPHTHARAHSFLISFPRQQWVCERASVLRYTYIICFVKKLFLMYRVVQIWLGRFVCKQVTVCPDHIWTTLYIKAGNPSFRAVSIATEFQLFDCCKEIEDLAILLSVRRCFSCS